MHIVIEASGFVCAIACASADVALCGAIGMGRDDYRAATGTEPDARAWAGHPAVSALSSRVQYQERCWIGLEPWGDGIARRNAIVLITLKARELSEKISTVQRHGKTRRITI